MLLRTNYWHYFLQSSSLTFMIQKALDRLMFLSPGFLDIFLNFPGYHRWQFTDVLRNILKIIASIAWAVILILCYFSSFPVSIPAPLKDALSFLPQAKKIPALYLMAIAIYIIPNVLAALLFIFPMLRRWIENSDWHIIRLLLWWSQVYNIKLYYI